MLELRLSALFQLKLTFELSGFQLPFATLPSGSLIAQIRLYHQSHFAKTSELRMHAVERA